MADYKTKYGTALTPTVTNLNSLASSSDFTAGWTSDYIDNSSVLALDYLVSAQLVTGTTPSAGAIRVYAYAQFPNGTDPDIFSSGTEGSQGAATVRDTEQLASALVLLWSTDTDTTSDDIHTMPPRSIAAAFGAVPRKFALFISHNTGVALKSTTQAVYADPISGQIV